MDSSRINIGVQNGMDWVSEPKINHEAETEKLSKKQERFRQFRMGSLIYALVYTFCLFRNSAGITYPFFVGATLLYFGYYTKKYTESCARERSLWTKAAWYRRFLVASALILGALNCMTDSGVLLFFNKALMYMILGVLLLQTWHDISGWSIAAHLKGLFHLGIGMLSQMLAPLYDRGAAKKLAVLRGEKKEKKDHSHNTHILFCICAGLVISIPLICVLLMLLGSADVVFYQLVCDIFSFTIDISVDHVMIFIKDFLSVAFRVLLLFVLSYGVLCYCNDKEDMKRVDDMAVRSENRFDVYIAMTVSVLVCVLYLVFSVIQIFGLFMGRLKLPEGYTYAEYARTGFFQLVFVCLINIVLVLCILAYFETGKALKAVLCVICGCTYIIEASSLFRLLMYINMYHLTFTRVLALWGLLVIAIVMGGVICCIFRPRLKLFQYVLVTVAVCWIAFSAAHPDYWIAKYNIAKSKTYENVDTYYIKNSLSLDAAPALVKANLNFADEYGEMNGKYKKWALEEYREDTKGLLGFRHFNFSRAYASACYTEEGFPKEAAEVVSD